MEFEFVVEMNLVPIGTNEFFPPLVVMSNPLGQDSAQMFLA